MRPKPQAMLPAEQSLPKAEPGSMQSAIGKAASACMQIRKAHLAFTLTRYAAPLRCQTEQVQTPSSFRRKQSAPAAHPLPQDSLPLTKHFSCTDRRDQKHPSHLHKRHDMSHNLVPNHIGEEA